MPLLHVNTFAQCPNFAIDDDGDLNAACEAIKREGIEIVIFDVLNKLHAADENDNSKMTAVMARFDRILTETGAIPIVIHHTPHSNVPGPGRARGAGAIRSWWEWQISIDVDPSDDTRKDVYFAMKAGMPHSQNDRAIPESSFTRDADPATCRERI